MSATSIPLLFGREIRRIHCLGISGMGVAPLAIYLAQLGFMVSGEDDAWNVDVRALLVSAGIRLTTLPDEAELVVYSSAISKTHPVHVAGTARALRLVRRGELLAEVLREKKLVAVCGSHGKTTTTAMLITALRAANFPAGYVLGGLFANGVSPASAGSNEWVVAEIDESDGTINGFAPEITIAVNLDWDHPDHYRQLADLEATFAALFGRTKTAVVVSEACDLSTKIAFADAVRANSNGKDNHRPSYYSFGRAGDFRSVVDEESNATTTLKLGGEFVIAGAVVRTRGDFNAANATAALAAAQLMGVTLSPQLLADFPGVLRRQTLLRSAGGLTVLEDYAHHPAEIRALLVSLRRRVAVDGRLIVVFQPHRFSRTVQFKTEFAAALSLGDRLYLLEVYSAGEAPIMGGTSADVYAEVKRTSPTLAVSYLPGGEAGFLRVLSREVKSGDLVAFVGAGDIDRKARTWLGMLDTDAAAGRRWDDFVAGIKPTLSDATKLKREEPLGPKTTIRIGGAARVYAEPANLDDLRRLLIAAEKNTIDVYVLGRGSNVLIPDEGVDGLVLSLAHETWSKFELRGDGCVWAGGGLRLKNLCGLAAKAGLSGFEFLEGIPGSVGGALRMNAGAMGGWMFDVVEEVQLLTLSGELRTLKKAEMHVGYRHCEELDHAIALGTWLRSPAAVDTEAVSRQIDVYRRKRQESQPRDPSAGCMFKNPPGDSAGRLIDRSGLKGERVGGVEVSTVHANFMVNCGAATSADVIELVRRVRARVQEAEGVELEPEVLLYGKKWKDVL